MSIPATGGLQIYPYSGFKLNFRFRVIQAPRRAFNQKWPIPQSDLYYRDL